MGYNSNWGTPAEELIAIHHALGGIDLDPCSTQEDNRRVKAKYWFGRYDSSLTKSWGPGSVYCNPPGLVVPAFWKKMMLSRHEFTHGIFALFNLEGIRTLQGMNVPSPMQFPFCVPKSRTRWLDPEVPDGEDPRTRPMHGNAFVYVPGTHGDIRRFMLAFERLGECICPEQASV